MLNIDEGELFLAGLPTRLKHGDIILFGSDSQLRVHLMPASNEGTTVEQHLRAECQQWTERIRVNTLLALPSSAALPMHVAHGSCSMLTQRARRRAGAGARGAACERAAEPVEAGEGGAGGCQLSQSLPRSP